MVGIVKSHDKVYNVKSTYHQPVVLSKDFTEGLLTMHMSSKNVNNENKIFHTLLLII